MKPNQLKLGVLINYGSVVLGMVISLLYTPFMMRMMGTSEYGTYNLAVAFVSNLNLLSLGLNSAFVRYYSRYKAQQDVKGIRRLNGMFMSMYLLISFIALLAGLVIMKNTHIIFGNKLTAAEMEKVKLLVPILVVNVAITFPESLFESTLVVNERYVFHRLMNALKTVLNPLLMMPLLLFGFRSVAMALLTTIIHALHTLWCALYCRKVLHMKFSFRRFDFRLMKEIFAFTSFVFLGIVVDQLNWSVDKYLLGLIHGSLAVAVYSAADQLNMYYLAMATTLSNVLIPRVHRIVSTTNDNRELTKLFTRVGRLQFMLLAMVFLGFFTFGRPFIDRFWGGAEYSDAYIITLLLMGSTIVPSIQNLGIEIQRAKNMHQFRSVMYLIVAVANILMSIPLCKWLGGIGAAIGTAIAVFFGNGLAMNWYYHRAIGLNIVYFWKRILMFLPALVAPTALGVLLFLFADMSNLLVLLAWGVVFVIVYCGSMWLLGMNQYEKNLVGRPIQKIVGLLCRKRTAVQKRDDPRGH